MRKSAHPAGLTGLVSYGVGGLRGLGQLETYGAQSGCGHDAHTNADGLLTRGVVALVQVVGGVTGGTGTQSEHRSGHLLQHPREVLAAHGLLHEHDGVLPQLGTSGVLEHGGFQVGIHDRGHAADVLHSGIHSEGNGDLLDDFVQQVTGLAPHLNVRTCTAIWLIA